MPLFQLFLVAVIQGLTEFLPVSSSGHLILLPGLTGLQDQGQLIDVAVHVGTLGAVILYFWTDVRAGLVGLLQLLLGRTDTPGARLALGLIVATIPVILCGAMLHFTGLSDAMRSVTVIGWTMLIFGIVLYWADQTGGDSKTAKHWTVRDALAMGLWQAVSLIPGTSRSGITITGARRLGYGRGDAARLSMLMSIPTIMASGILLGAEVALDANTSAMRDGAIAAALAFVSALLALTLMMRLLRSISFTPYVIYRIVLGIALLVYAYGGSAPQVAG
ncbi:undecaprenyl-diphosphate phosphatase [Sedimentitalea sp. JM2-8]|uniref:Undecaprenyl-diphosphatase n=1 Tax=Sedimentitalea xiamensis TaxID=3050037 RepID=A0ABT7FJ69_9RHOB|nr:undecaprenyl-diphosphate phosphatase [Sedimentitalea xiamensis]MDK3075075.1 undecaprenyl-diphosphate phosphatase [Sedimentitalea xiamensis]